MSDNDDESIDCIESKLASLDDAQIDNKTEDSKLESNVENENQILPSQKDEEEIMDFEIVNSEVGTINKPTMQETDDTHENILEEKFDDELSQISTSSNDNTNISTIIDINKNEAEISANDNSTTQESISKPTAVDIPNENDGRDSDSVSVNGTNSIEEKNELENNTNSQQSSISQTPPNSKINDIEINEKHSPVSSNLDKMENIHNFSEIHENKIPMPMDSSKSEIKVINNSVQTTCTELISLIKSKSIKNNVAISSLFNILVNGQFDMEDNFIIDSADNVLHMLDIIDACDIPLQTEIWCVFFTILKKSTSNQLMCCEAGLTSRILDRLSGVTDNALGDLMVDLVGTLVAFSVTVKDLSLLFQFFKAREGKWSRHAIKLLSALREIPKRIGPDDFFSFPGKKGSAMAIPPISKWPYQNGWTFNAWFHLEPVSGSNIDREKPFLYCFRTNKGVGYSGHFLGNSLVITAMIKKMKGFQHCVRYEFQPRRWYMVTIVHVYNRWSKSEIRCYVDGQLVSQGEMSWMVATNDMFDRCTIGSTPEQEQDCMFSGQISSLYGFSEALSPQQINAIYALGSAYKGQFRYENETNSVLSETQRKVIYEGRLSTAIVFTYNPVACDRQLALDQTPKSNPSIFPHSPHALMMGEVKPVITQSIQSTLHSLGGIQIFFPLFNQLDCLHKDGSTITAPPLDADDVTPEKEESESNQSKYVNISSLLLSLVCDLLRSSPTIQQQFLQSRGFLVISQYLDQSSPVHTNQDVLDTVLRLTRSLLKAGQAPVPLALLKQLYDHILYNPPLWTKATVKVQTNLYNFLATEFLTEARIFNSVRRVSAVLQTVHTLKYYYWIANPRDRSGFSSKTPENAIRPTISQLATIRANLLVYIKQLVMRGVGIMDDELQAILNYLTTVHEDDNLRDVLYFTLTLMSQHPSSMVPSFDRKNGLRCVFKLLASEDEDLRIYALKLLGLFLMRSTHKRKHDSMGPHNLFSLIGERLLLYSQSITMATYNALFEILTERLTLTISQKKHPDPDSYYRLENPLLLKVIAHLIRHSRQTEEVQEVRTLFLHDLSILCNNNKDNRRTVLQMSVWQDWMFALAPIYPSTPAEEETTQLVMSLFRLLLHHAIKLEFGGWRVWIDTLAILHSKVAYHDFKHRMTQVYHAYDSQRADNVSDPSLRRQLPVSSIAGVTESTGYETSGQSAQRGGVTITEVAKENQEPSDDAKDTPTKSSDTDSTAANQKTPSEKSANQKTSSEESANQKTSSEESANQEAVLDKSANQKPASDESANKEAAAPDSSGNKDRGKEGHIFSPGPRPPVFRIPDFTWSYLHQRLLHDLLTCIESDIQVWKGNGTKNIIEFVNASENHVYVINLIHLVSQLSDTLVTSCGGLLPLLAAATSANGEVDMLEASQGMKMEEAVGFLMRLMNLADIVVFASSQNFLELEQEKNMANGGILRQCLRLVCTCAVRNCLESRYRLLFSGQPPPASPAPGDILPPDRIQELVRGLRIIASSELESSTNSSGQPGHQVLSAIKNVEVLLQEMDVTRLRAVVYRDAEETKQAQFLALAIVYFISVLMVSKYRDILEPPTPLTATPASSRVPSSNLVEQSSKGDGKDKPSPSRLTPDDSSLGDVSSSSGDEDVERGQEDASKKSDQAISSEDVAGGDVSQHDEDADENGKPPTSSPGKEAVVEQLRRESGDVDRREEEAKRTVDDAGDDEEETDKGIASIQIADDKLPSRTGPRNSDFNLPQLPPVTPHHPAPERQGADLSLTTRLERALGTASPLLREIFIDFATFLSKTLLGSHGQELLTGGLIAIKQSTSVVELVMLLCSQEWQNSLQKHAGLAFIELVNEGRLLSHATRDHIVRVANEAEYILNRMRADDVAKHADFEQLTATSTAERKEEERLCDLLISSARQRDLGLARKVRDRVDNIMTDKHGVWASPEHTRRVHFKLDTWEDDSRRRRRFVPNPLGSSHPEATLLSPSQEASIRARTAIGPPVVPVCSATGGSGSKEETYGVTDEELTMPPTAPPVVSSSGTTGAQQQSGGQQGSQQVPLSVDMVDQNELEVEGPIAMSTTCKLLAPGVVVQGLLSITKAEMYFEMDTEDEENMTIDENVLQYVDCLHGKWAFTEIRAVFSRRYLHKNVALEIFIANRSAVMFAFSDQSTVKRVVSCLPRVGIGVKYNLPQNRRSSLATPRQIFKHSTMTQRWQRREISNFDYLMYLNTVAGRTFNDLNQYPIFPWVLANYESSDLDLSSPSNYRDLSLPVGALNPSRREFFEDRYSKWDDDGQPAFHYGTHYSTAAFVLNYLLRIEPFTTMFINFQGGKFDHANRTFHSICQTWKNCQRDTSDVKELIPEFFYLGDMLENMNGYHLGVTEEGVEVQNVQLPPWAKTAHDFVRINRQALESELVSCQLHHWIDLIFGYKQRGPEAVRATNVFCHLTYEGSVDWSRLSHDPMMRQALEDQIRSFGQTPSQLLLEPHPPRNSALHVTPTIFSPVTEDVCMILKFLSNSPVILTAANTHPACPVPAVTVVTANHNYAVNLWNNSAAAISRRSVLGSAVPTSDSSTVAPLELSATSPQNSASVNVGNTNESQLPLSMDRQLAQSVTSPRRTLGDNFDERLRPSAVQFDTTPDNKILFACGYWDKSFRVYSIDSGRIMQVVYGHFGVVTCLSRSEAGLNQDCYLVTGSEDCTVSLWLWAHKQQAIVADNGSSDQPSPRATLTGHQDEVVCVMVSSELGLIASGSKDGICLLHTTQGELLRSLTLPPPDASLPASSPHFPASIQFNREGFLALLTSHSQLAVYSLNGRLLHSGASPCVRGSTQTLLVSRCGQYLLCAGDGGQVQVVRTHDLTSLYAFPACDSAIRSLALTHDQKFLLAGLSSGCLVVFNIDFNRWHHEFQERYSSSA